MSPDSSVLSVLKLSVSSLSPSISLVLYLCPYFCLHLFIHPPTLYPPLHLPIHPSICLSTHLSISLTILCSLSALTGRFPDYPDESLGGSYLIYADKTPEQVPWRWRQETFCGRWSLRLQRVLRIS